MGSGLRWSLLFLLFFVSGFCGLLYQIVWLRLAFASFGVITPVLSVVISVFMGGLSLGSWLGGRWIAQWTRSKGRSAVIWYGLAEILIGVSAFAVPTLFRWGEAALGPVGEISSLGYLALSALVIALAILPWCFLMGTTFPFMTGYIKQFSARSQSGFSYLYLANVMGAMFGVLLTALVLIELWGFRQTLLLAGLLNFGIGAVSVTLALGHRGGFEAPPVDGFRPVSATAARSVLPRRLVFTILFGTGFVSMAMEVVWTRAFTPILETTIYAFAGLLAVYLLSTWLGTLVHRVLLRIGHAPGYGVLMAALATAACLPLVLPDPRVVPFKWVALASIAPMCGILGYLTPRLIDEDSAGFPASVGRAYAFNIVGSLLGPLCAGYLLLPWLGSKWALVVLALPLLALAVWIWSSVARSRATVAVVLVATLALGYAALRSTTFEDGGLYPRSVVRRDYTATVISTNDGRRERLLVNGVGITHKTPITKMMAHLPLAWREDPARRALVICFGMGTTLRSVASWGVPVTAVELVPSVKDAFGYYFDDAQTVLARPDVEVVIDDGRRFLKRTDQMFDMVTIDPPPPVETAGSSLLYSVEFYEVLKERMTQDAILQQWFPGGEEVILQGVAAALFEAFPFVEVFRSFEGWGFHFLASKSPLPERTGAELFARLPPAAIEDLEEWVPEQTIPDLFVRTVNRRPPNARLLGSADAPAIRDDRPLNEYYLLRRRAAQSGRQ